MVSRKRQNDELTLEEELNEIKDSQEYTVSVRSNKIIYVGVGRTNMSKFLTLQRRALHQAYSRPN